MRLLISFLFLGTSLLCFSQKVKIDCPPKTKLKKDVSLGYLNLRGVQLGEIYKIKTRGTKIKDMSLLGAKIVAIENMDTSSVTKLRQHKTNIDFTITTTGDVSDAFKAELQSELNRAITFNLYNTRPYLIRDPYSQIAYYDPNIFPISSKEVYALINRVTIADSLIILTERGLDIDASSNVNVGDYEIQIVNNCNGIIRFKGKQVPVFFEFLVFKPTITTVTSPVVGITEGNEKKSVKLKKVTWVEVKNMELDDDFENP